MLNYERRLPTARDLMIVLMMLIVCAVVSQSITAQSYQIVYGVFGNSGGGSANATFSVQGTLGQPGIDVGSNASYRLMSGICYDSNGVMWLDVADDLGETPNLPLSFNLEQNYPNPFNPTTIIRFSLPKECRAIMTLHNILGQTVAAVIDKELSAGEYEVHLNGEGLASGVYFYQLVAGEFRQTKKLILLK